jgi:hypothetical protein
MPPEMSIPKPDEVTMIPKRFGVASAISLIRIMICEGSPLFKLFAFPLLISYLHKGFFTDIAGFHI